VSRGAFPRRRGWWISPIVDVVLCLLLLSVFVTAALSLPTRAAEPSAPSAADGARDEPPAARVPSGWEPG